MKKKNINPSGKGARRSWFEVVCRVHGSSEATRPDKEKVVKVSLPKSASRVTGRNTFGCPFCAAEKK